MLPAMSFDGFPRGGVDFFRELAVRQDRDWFKAHKADYERLWQKPLTALFDELHEKLQRTFPEVKKSKPKVFRIYRDVRFSRDKSPFKTHAAGLLPLYPSRSTPEAATGFYASFGADIFLGGGRWHMEGDELARFRKALLADKTGVPFAKSVQKLEAKGFTHGAHDVLKRPPPGVDKAHPRVALLKLKGFALGFPPRRASDLADGRKLVAGIVKDVEAAAPVLRWLQALSVGKPLPRV